MERRAKLLIVVAPAIAALAAIALLPPLKQALDYHDFADARACGGVPHCADVASNLPLLIFGLMGLAWLGDRAAWRNAFADARERWPYFCFFLGVTAVAFGSAWYHLAPDNPRLVWDRLPIVFSLAALFSATIVDRVSVRAGLMSLVPFLLIAAGSALYWRWSMTRGEENLMPYVAVQAYAWLAVLLIALFFPSRYSRGADLYVVLGLYVLAKLTEALDRGIFEFGQILSGHTVKHLLAGLAVYWLLRMLRHRHPLAAHV